MRYFLIAGEPSGDLHGSNLMRGIMKADSEAEFRFWGGDRMAEVGGVQNLGLHYRESSFFGFMVIFSLPTILRQIKECKSQIDSFKPDVVILIDYAGFNLRIARYAKKRGFKSYFYIAPKVWAWNEGRVKKIRKYVDELFIIFPFERAYFKKHGITAHFEGNPLVDAIAAKREMIPPREKFLEQNSLCDRPIVALVAGSRATEIRANLPLMRAAADALPHYQFVVAGVDWLDKELYEKVLEGSQVRYIEGQTYELLHHSTAAIVTSGTATLETALIGTPQVVLYKLPTLYNLLYPYIMKIPYISLVNINLGKESVREIMDSSSRPDRLIAALKDVLPGGARRDETERDYRELSEIIGPKGASDRFAERVVNLLKESK